jgi:spermidine synthase
MGDPSKSHTSSLAKSHVAIIGWTIFFASGFAGLVYQSLWARYLGTFVGHAAYAQALVLAIFMGGMAIGSWYASRKTTLWSRLIYRYAQIEGLIALLAFLFHWAFFSATAFTLEHVVPVLGPTLSGAIAKFAVAGLLIIPQCILLGMTFPLMASGMLRCLPGQDSSQLGGLYFTNSFGAAVGVLVGTFILVPGVGMHGALVIAGTVNLSVAVAAFWFSRAVEKDKIPNSSESGTTSQNINPSGLMANSRLVVIFCALSGAASFVYEIVWVRMLSLAVGSTLHAFELMLAAFVGGIAFGGLWVSRYGGSRDPLALAGWMQVLMGLAAIASLAVFGGSFEATGWMLRTFTRSESGYALFNIGTAALACAVMFPTAFCAGTTLPLFTLALVRSGAGESVIGKVYAWNTVGSIGGIVLAVHVLMPMLGVRLALSTAALLDLFIGLAILKLQSRSENDLAKLRYAAIASVMVFAVIISQTPFDPLQLASGVFRHGTAKLSADDYQSLFYRDGKTASISVRIGRTGEMSVATNGKVDAGVMMDPAKPSSTDEPTMVLLGALPLAFHPLPQKVGVIGFGSGISTHTVLADTRVRRVDTMEIEAAMVDAARLFGPHSERAFSDPRSNIVIDDAKAYLASQREPYDILISEPSNPWISGVGSLFTDEFYRFAVTKLGNDGLFVQWIQMYEIDDRLLASIGKALVPHFKHIGAWMSNGGDLLVIASNGNHLRTTDYSPLFSGALKNSMHRVGIDEPRHLAQRKVADARVFRALADMYPVRANSYTWPILSLEAPKARFVSASALTFSRMSNGVVPVAEAMGIRPPLHDEIPLVNQTHLPLDGSRRLARANGRFLMTGILEPWMEEHLIGKPLTPSIELREAARQVCANPSNTTLQVTLLKSLREYYDVVTPGASPDTMVAVFGQPSWLPCIGQLPREIVTAIRGLGLSGARQWQQAAQWGREWLSSERDSTHSATIDDIALAAVLLAQAQKQDWKQLIADEQLLGKEVLTKSVEYAAARGLLLAIANTQLKQEAQR